MGWLCPTPPVLRALEHTRQTLEKAGHEGDSPSKGLFMLKCALTCIAVISFVPPFNYRDVSQTTFGIYYPSGVRQILKTLETSGEPPIPVFSELQIVYAPKELSAAEALQLNVKMRIFKEQFLAAWNESSQRTQTGRPIDALVCPSAPTIGLPHDFNIYWGYTSLFNIFDYPSIILPIPNCRVSAEQDPMDSNYRPLSTNPYDISNHHMCKSS
ncbi:amidase signature domain-containing protein [Xylogone sp. PMI_703]|nr:amidase signature domain-containing protein [Xylogone sp. PMI_703]